MIQEVICWQSWFNIFRCHKYLVMKERWKKWSTRQKLIYLETDALVADISLKNKSRSKLKSSNDFHLELIFYFKRA